MSSSRNCSRPFRKVGCAALVLACASACAGAQSAPAGESVLRIWGYTGLTPLLLRWEEAYQQLHPEVHFDNQMHGPAAVMAGLYDGVADFALMGREIWPNETMAYRWVYQQQPFAVAVATAGLNAPGESFSPVVLVNAKNPLAAITVAQLDAIYGSEHRAAPANIRTWGELGLTGEWANKPVHAYGYGAEDALGVYFRHDVLRMDFKPNPESHLLSDRDPGNITAAQRIAEAVAADPYAIGYANPQRSAAVKVLPVAGAQPVVPTEATLTDHEYPLTRTISLYFRREPGKPLDPKVNGFVQFLLSAQAQALVRPAEGFLPLTTEAIDKQKAKLQAPMPAAGVAEDPGL